jgi:hypothetical protein
MADFFFFTDVDLLDSVDLLSQYSQPENQSFAFSETKNSKDYFLVNSVHKSIENPFVYAVVDGHVAVHPHTNGIHATLVLSPKVQPNIKNKVDLPNIKYYIYRGVLIDHLISGLNIAAQGNGIDMIDYLWKHKESENILKESILTKIDNALQENTHLNYSFQKSNFTPVNAGDSIGIFDKDAFSFQVVFEDLGYDLKLSDLNSSEYPAHKIVVDSLNSNPNNFQQFQDRHYREEVLHYMDPSAFYGSFYFSKIKYKNSVDRKKINKTENIYNDLLVKFFNQNHIYIDIRNEHNRSFNYYSFLNDNSYTDNEDISAQYYSFYDDEINIGYYKSTKNDLLYYYNNWPIKKFENKFVYASTEDEDVNKYDIKIKTYNKLKETRFTIFWKSGFRNFDSKKFNTENLKGENRFESKINSKINNITNKYIKFQVQFPNIILNNKRNNVCFYNRIFILRDDQTQVNQGGKGFDIRSQSRFFGDYLFYYNKFNIDININSNFFKIFQTDSYVNFINDKNPNNEFGISIGQSGYAIDSSYITLFYNPEVKIDVKKSKRVSVDLPLSGGIFEKTSSFLEYIDKKLIKYGLEHSILNINDTIKPYVYDFSPSSLFNLFNTEKIGLIIYILKKTDWTTINSTINSKISDGSINSLFDISFVIKYRNDLNVSIIDDYDESNPVKKYFSFDLYAKGFKNENGKILPVEIDLGLKFYGFQDEHSKEISTIFTAGTINQNLLSENLTLNKIECPEIKFDTSSFDYLVPNIEKEEKIPYILNKVSILSGKIFFSDFSNYLKEMYHNIFGDDSISSPIVSGQDIKSGKHNNFLIYQNVLSKFIETDLIPIDVVLKKSEKDDTLQNGFEKKIYDTSTQILKSYSNVFKLNSENIIPIGIDENGFLKTSSSITTQGFLYEAAFTFAIWKLGNDLNLIHKFLKNLSLFDSDPECIDKVFFTNNLKDLKDKSTLFADLYKILLKNKVLTPDLFSKDISKNEIEKFADLFDSVDEYSDSYTKEGNNIFGFITKFENYLSISANNNPYYSKAPLSDYRICIQEFYARKNEYLKKYTECIYMYFNGKGLRSDFHFFGYGKMDNSTSHIFNSKIGLAFLELISFQDGGALKEENDKKMTFDLGDRTSGYIRIIHFGNYGIDSSTFTHLKISAKSSKSKPVSSFYLKDKYYRMSNFYDAGYHTSPTNLKELIWKNGTEIIGYFDIEAGDLFITDSSINQIIIDFKGGEEKSFITVAVAEIPAAVTMSFAKSFFDLFDDDVFQLTELQQQRIWDVSVSEEVNNMDTLLDILYRFNPTILVTMYGGNVGTTIIPLGYDISQSYLEGDVVTFISTLDGEKSLNIFERNSNFNTTELGIGWKKNSYDTTQLYAKDDLISDGSSIWKCLKDFNISKPFDENDWIEIATLYREDTNYTPDLKNVLIISNDVNQIATPYTCSFPTSGIFDLKAWNIAQQIRKDYRYDFVETSEGNWSPGILLENVSQPAQNSLKAVQNARVRYSHLKITWNPNNKNINIDIVSYASPLISRLDRKFQDRSQFSKDLLNNNTIYGSFPLSNSCINHPTDGLIPSYNQELSALRNWGILEGMKNVLLNRISEIQDKYDDKATEFSTVITTKLTEMMLNANVKTVESIDNTKNKIIDYNAYSNLKF